jgi:hypothetical protein
VRSADSIGQRVVEEEKAARSESTMVAGMDSRLRNRERWRSAVNDEIDERTCQTANEPQNHVSEPQKPVN